MVSFPSTAWPRMPTFSTFRLLRYCALGVAVRRACHSSTMVGGRLGLGGHMLRRAAPITPTESTNRKAAMPTAVGLIRLRRARRLRGWLALRLELSLTACPDAVCNFAPPVEVLSFEL